MKDKLNKIFQDQFSVLPQAYFFSPARVNLIGGHTDYNGGLVLPCTISLGTYGGAKKRSDLKFGFYSENFKEFGRIEIDINDMDYRVDHGWVNYAKGVIYQFIENGFIFEYGFDLCLIGNIPGGGLSSSSSLELLVCVLIKSLYGFELEMLDMVIMSRAVENKYMGLNSGIMDQFIIGMGIDQHAILLNTSNLDYRYVPLDLKGYAILIANTNKVRKLTDSKYNERYEECQDALKLFKRYHNISFLCELSQMDFDRSKKYISSETLKGRTRHVISENKRVLKSYQALLVGDLQAFGKYMYESHISLRDDYDVSCLELDTMVDLLLKEEGVIGARMTGAGFGGCTVSIVKESCIDKVIENVSRAYHKKIGYPGDFHLVTTTKGAGSFE